ncbi:MFS family permease [Deinococcus metalli]|uniref:MFS family permease n=1 Tax=Deinococcus metalli TaxID=1141878 RepID=A0A7W8NM44_9DEIO|nr:MFS transporter [Deinococcus metalli]MBB5375379.1 MFS family permease [Deinococcus metalli]GHF29735.1 MFS transporter [Deinococcus metalli]
MTATIPPSGPTGRAKLILFLTIFSAMLGLSILFPIIAPLGRELGLSETQTAWFSTAYSLMQFVFSPIWGARSERSGRKPVLLLGLCGFALSFGLFGVIADLGLRGVLGGTALFALLVAARVLGGMLSSATLPTAQAMMADLSAAGDRAAGMGLIGAAFGLGVVFGPGLGALLSTLGLTAPVYFSAALGLLTAVVAARVLPETRHARGAAVTGTDRRTLFARPGIPLFLALSALTTLASVGMEQTIGFFVQDTLHLTPAGAARSVGGMLAVFGVVAALVQGGAIRPLAKRVPPTPLIATGLAVMGAGMLLLPGMTSFWPITAALAVIGVGSAVLSPSLSAALSLSVGEDEQGTVAGLNSSALALGRMTGPLIGTGLYQHVGHGAPYLLSGGVLGAALLWTLVVRPKVTAQTPVPNS